MQIIHTQKFIHTTPRKLRLVADMVRRMTPLKALDILTFTPKAAAKDLSGAISAALGNAKQSGVDIEKANFQLIEINEGPKMARYRAGTRGRAKPYKRRMAHIKIILSDDVVELVQKVSKPEVSETVKKEEK